MKLGRPLVLLALAAVLPLTILAAALGASGLRQEQQAMRARAETQVELASVRVQQHLDHHVAVLTAVAQSFLFDGRVDKAAAGAYLARVAENQPFWRAISVADPQGNRLTVYPAASDVPPHIVDFGSFQRAVETRRPAIGQVVRRANRLMAFAVRVPIVRGGQVVYVVTALVSPEGLRQLYLDNPLPERWPAGVVDAAGRVVVRVNASQEVVGGAAAQDTLRIRRLAPRGFVRTVTVEGAPVINAFRVLPGYGWSVHVAIPLDEYQSPFVRSLWLVAGTTVVCVALAVLFLWLLAREAGLRQREASALEEGRRMEALGRMTGGVAHDFNNLLMIVQGSAEMLKRRRYEPERIAGFADAILSAAQRGQTLTRQLLAFARKNVHEPVDFRLQDRAAVLEELIRRSVGDRVAVSMEVPTDAWAVRADPDALEIALINLSVNARDAMEGEGALSIVAANVALRRDRSRGDGLEGEFLTIAVKDTGPGVPEEHLGHIFEPFYTTKPMGRGTGLGLSQVYGFARQSGGAVTVASRPGEGATFTLYLPRAAVEPATAAKASAASHAEEPGRLLLVDDDPEVTKALEAMLASGGYAVTAVSDTAAAMRMIARQPFDVVLVDLLADRSGLGLVAALRRDRPDLAALLMTGRPDRVGEAGSDGVLLKPFGPDQVFKALSQARAAARRAA